MHVAIDGERGNRRGAGKRTVWRVSSEPPATPGPNIQSDKLNVSNFSIFASSSSSAVVQETFREADKVAPQTRAGFQGNSEASPPPSLEWLIYTPVPLCYRGATVCLFQPTSSVITASGQLQLISCNKPTVMFLLSLSRHANLAAPARPLPPFPHTSTTVAVLRWLRVSLPPNEVSSRRRYE